MSVYNPELLSQIGPITVLAISNVWSYTDTSNTVQAMEASGFFAIVNDNDDLNQVQVGDALWLVGSNGSVLVYFATVNPFTVSVNVSDASVIQVASVSVPLANFLAMYDTPVPIIPAQGAGTLIVFNQAQIVQTYGSAALANGGVVGFQYNNTDHAGGVICSTTIAAASFFVTASTVYNFNPGVVLMPFTTCANQGIYLSCASGDFTGGTASTFQVNITYSVIESGV